MLQLTPQSVVYVASTYVDFRKGIDGLASICRQQFALDPLGGALFLFYNRLRTTIKILCHDGQGMWLCSKRLSKGRFGYNLPSCSGSGSGSTSTSTSHSPTTASSATITSSTVPTTTNPYHSICYRALHVLINNGDPHSVKFSKNWRLIKQPAL